MMRLLKDQRGYSMIELIGAMTIFAIISIAIVGALISVLQSSTKTGAERRTQQDARYNIEEMARETRSSSIDYAFYSNNAGDSRCALGTSANPNASRVLALIFTESDEANAPVSKRLIFFQDNGAVYRYEANVGSATPTCATIFDQADRNKISSDTVTVPTLTFYISPNADPYSQAPCGVGNQFNCQVAKNTHPRVTILMKVEIQGSGSGVTKQAGTGTTTIQTTVNSRVYQTNKLAGS